MDIEKVAYFLFEIRYPKTDERPLFIGKTKDEWITKARELCDKCRDKKL